MCADSAWARVGRVGRVAMVASGPMSSGHTVGHDVGHLARWPKVIRLRLILTTLILLMSAGGSQGLSCYSCTVSPPPYQTNQTVKLCSEFDWSSRYIVDCPKSTFCRKTTVQLSLPNGKVIQNVVRDCAPQSYNSQVMENGTWRMKSFVVGEVYKEGCIKNEDFGVKASMSEHCYCDTNLCNAGQPAHDTSYTHHTDAMAVIFVFNAVKYLRSLR